MFLVFFSEKIIFYLYYVQEIETVASNEPIGDFVRFFYF